MADASTSSDFAKIPSWQCSDMLAIADIGFFANMAYTRVQRKILEIRLSDLRIGSIISCAFGSSDLGALRRYKSLMWLGHTARFAPSIASLTLTAKCTTYC